MKKPEHNPAIDTNVEEDNPDWRAFMMEIAHWKSKWDQYKLRHGKTEKPLTTPEQIEMLKKKFTLKKKK